MQQLAFCLLLTILSACASHKQAGVVYQTRFDFSQVKKYSLHQRNSDFVVFQSINDVTRNAIEIAIEKSMEKQGFSYSALGEADVIVSYHLISQTGEHLSKYNESVLYCAFCLRASNWQSDKKNWDSTAGNLIIDLIDVETKRSVWRSVYPLDINIQDNSRMQNDKIKSAIALMLALYPQPELTAT
jgi:hypothetical protein